jgi:enoyl-[acyl-carrier protein] reductase I
VRSGRSVHRGGPTGFLHWLAARHRVVHGGTSFAGIGKRWSNLDLALHSIASAPTGVSPPARVAIDVSCRSLLRMCRLAEPLMDDARRLFIASFHDADKLFD